MPGGRGPWLALGAREGKPRRPYGVSAMAEYNGSNKRAPLPLCDRKCQAPPPFGQFLGPRGKPPNKACGWYDGQAINCLCIQEKRVTGKPFQQTTSPRNNGTGSSEGHWPYEIPTWMGRDQRQNKKSLPFLSRFLDSTKAVGSEMYQPGGKLRSKWIATWHSVRKFERPPSISLREKKRGETDHQTNKNREYGLHRYMSGRSHV